MDSRPSLLAPGALLVILLLVGTGGPAYGVTQIIGDADGFGIDPTGLVRASASHTDPADVDGDGIIEPQEYLPDWNTNGVCNTGDPFDFRSPAEAADTWGAQWTDYGIVGSGASHLAAFHFEFTPPVLGDPDFEDPHFINFVFGDYDVSPTNVDIDGEIVELTLQGSGNDGLVQSAFADVPWSAVADGEVIITVHAPNEPYLAFDYALLDTSRLADADGDGIPGSIDNCPGTPNLDQSDTDNDGVGDLCDSCPDDPDSDQADSDADGQGDVCDPCPDDPTDDADADGFCAPEDCDPEDGGVHPDAHELCDDGIDNDCDGTIDQLPDGDGDGWDECAGDCDDNDPSTFPGAEEGCDGIDHNCDGELSEAEFDYDGDGFSSCDGDCEDDNIDVYPGAPIECGPTADADCSGVTDDLEAVCTGQWAQTDCGCSATGQQSPVPLLYGILLLFGLLRRRLK